MTNAFNGLIQRYGEDTQISWKDTKLCTKTFIQPVMSRTSKEKKIFTPLGEVSTTNYYWYAPAELELDTDEQITVESRGKTYELIKAEMFRAMGRSSHWEGILRLRG